MSVELSETQEAEVVEEAGAPVSDAPMVSMETFITDINDVINFHHALGPNIIIGLLIQLAAQVAINHGIKMKKFLAASKEYFIKVKRLMDT